VHRRAISDLLVLGTKRKVVAMSTLPLTTPAPSPTLNDLYAEAIDSFTNKILFALFLWESKSALDVQFPRPESKTA
jgi:hypothetical protein